MILGLGLDICSIKRIEKTYKNFSKFEQRILTKEEIEKVQNLSEAEKIKFLAKIWAIKEATAKATKLGLSKMGFKNLWLTHAENGEPKLQISAKLDKIIKNFFGIEKYTLHLTISHEENFVSAIVILEKR